MTIATSFGSSTSRAISKNNPPKNWRCPYLTAQGNSFQHHEIEKTYKNKDTFRGNSLKWCCTPTPSNQCPYQVSTCYALQFWRYSPDKICKLKVLQQGRKVKSKSHHDIVHLHPQPLSLPSTHILHFMVSEIQPGQAFPHHPPGRHG